MQLKDLGILYNATKELKEVGNAAELSGKSFNILKKAFDGLSESEIIAKLSSSGLTNELKKQIGEIAGVTLSTDVLSASQKEASISTLGLGTAFKGLKAEILNAGTALKSFVISNPEAATLIAAIAAVTVIVAAYKHFNPTIEKATADLKEQQAEFESTASDVEELSKQLKTANDRIEELNNQGHLSIIESEELENLKETTAELESQLALMKEKQKLAARETLDAANKAYNGRFTSKYDENGNYKHGNWAVGIIGMEIQNNNPVKELQNTTKALTKLQQEYDEARKNANFFYSEMERHGGPDSATGKVDYQSYKKYQKQLEDIKEQQAEASEQATKMYDAVNGQKLAYEALHAAGEELLPTEMVQYETLKAATEEYEKQLALINGTANAYKNLNASEKRNKIAQNITIEYGYSYQEAKEILSEFTDEDLDIIAQIDISGAIESARQELKDELTGYSIGNVDLSVRPIIDSTEMMNNGWDIGDGNVATTLTQGEFIWQGDEENGKYVYVHITPITPDGKEILSPDALNQYINEVLEGSDDILSADNKSLVLKVDDIDVSEAEIQRFQGPFKIKSDNIDKIINEANSWDNKIHEVQERFYLNSAQTAAEGIRKVIDATKNSVNPSDNNVINPQNITQSISQITQQLKPQFEALGKAYQDIFTDKGFTLDNVDNDMLDSILKAFENLGENVDFDKSKLEDFFSVLSNGASQDEVQNAFDSLVTSYLNSTQVLDNLNDTNAKSIILQLEKMGAVNAEAVVTDLLNTKKEAEAIQEQALQITKDGVTETTKGEIDALLNEAGASETARQYLFKLAAQEQVFGATDLDVSGKISALKELAEAYGQDAIAARIAAMEQQAADSHTTFNPTQADLNRFAEEINAAINNVHIDFAPINKSSSKKAGKKTADEYLKAFEKELKLLQSLRDQGKITEKEYLDQLRKLYIRYFADKKKYLDEYEKYEHEYLDGMKSLYEKVFSAIGKKIDKKIDKDKEAKDAAIDALKKEKEAAEKALEARKEAIEEEIKSVEKEISAKEKIIDGINDEIDAIKEKNEERQRAIDLQQKEYALARAQNQRTQLTYQDGQMIWRTDPKSIRDAAQDVEDAKTEIQIAEKEKQIKQIEREISLLEERKDALQEQQDEIEKLIDKSNEYYDNMISQTEEYWDKKIKGLEDYKAKWEELGSIIEDAEIDRILADFNIAENDILNQSEEAFQKVKSGYLSVLKDIYSGNNDMLASISKVAEVNTDALNGYLSETKSYIDELGKINLESMETALSSISDGFGKVASSAGEATAAVSGTGTVATDTDEAGTASTAGTSFDSAISSSSENAVAQLGETSDAFAGDENSIKSSVGEVVDVIGPTGEKTTDSDTAALSPTLEEHVAYATSEEGIPAETAAFSELSSTLGEAEAHLEGIKNLLFEMDGKTFTVTVEVNHNNTAGSYSHFSKGGLITTKDKGTLDPFAKAVGEDHMIAVQEGEIVLSRPQVAELTKQQASQKALSLTPLKDVDSEKYGMLMSFKNVSSTLDSAKIAIDNIEKQIIKAVNAPDITKQQNIGGDIKLEIGDIKLYGVQSPDVLAKAIVNTLPAKIMQELHKR